MRILLILFALLTQPTPTPPPLTAAWESSDVARLSWSGAGCLWIDQALYRCYDGSGALLLGRTGPLDGVYRPTAFDVFRLVRADGSMERAVLGSVLYFPVFRTNERAPLVERVYVALWR